MLLWGLICVSVKAAKEKKRKKRKKGLDILSKLLDLVFIFTRTILAVSEIILIQKYTTC